MGGASCLIDFQNTSTSRAIRIDLYFHAYSLHDLNHRFIYYIYEVYNHETIHFMSAILKLKQSCFFIFHLLCNSVIYLQYFPNLTHAYLWNILNAILGINSISESNYRENWNLKLNIEILKIVKIQDTYVMPESYMD
jgi:hypothetical protein